jgi:alginate O-acetyltransferase complex protein AlgI
MLFNSFAFIFLFLPIVLCGYFAFARLGQPAAVVWPALASVAFYAIGNWQFVPLLLLSVAFNYAIGSVLIWSKPVSPLRFWVLTLGVFGDLVILGIFKYAGFFASNLNAILGTTFVVDVLLPVGISFYTFTQIAFLVDAYKGKIARYSPPHYALFVTYFPHLVAGPILHHKDIIPQFERTAANKPDFHAIVCGLLIFAIGLFKKTCLADRIQPLVASAFGATVPSFDQAWIGALAYTFQLYFDFSGYSDMAIGISLMFGIFLPLNFDSPYKAGNIIDFWRRWHITLSQFLRDYLYIPLGGNRRGRVLRYVNLMITMLLGGLWHGAAWTFVIWGALHGTYLCINHAWKYLAPKSPRGLVILIDVAAVPITFTAVVVAWVFFRADSIASALTILSKMIDPRHIVYGEVEAANLKFIAAYAVLVWLAPNTQELTGYQHANRSVGENLAAWPFRPLLLYGTALLLVVGLLGIHQHSEFIYFRF